MYLKLIHNIKSIISLSEGEEERIRTIFKMKFYRKGDYLLKEGQICKEVGFINEGLVRYFINKDGEELIYDFGRAGNYTCNYQSFLDKSVSTKNIQCIEDTVLLSISFDHLQLLYEKVKEGQKFGRIICEQIYVDSLDKITSLYNDTPENRYIQFTKLYPDLQQRIPQYYISSFVGIKPQSLSRIRKRIAAR